MKLAIFIDGNNFYHGLKSVYGDNRSLSEFDFTKLIKFLLEENEIVGIYYYNAELDKTRNYEKYEKQKEFFSKLRQINNFKLVLCKLLKRRFKKTKEYYYVLKEDDIHMAIDMLEGAVDNKFDIALVVSGDGDFVPAVKAVQRRRKIVKNIYFKKSSSRNLKNHCNNSIELTKDILDKCFCEIK